MITIREMTESDATAASRIVSECYRFIAGPDGFTNAQLDALLRERCRPDQMVAMRSQFQCFVAKIENEVVGLLALDGNSIEELFVPPARHRQGVGSALLRHAERRVHAGGYLRMTVSTTGYGRPFYETMGMHVVGTSRVTFGPLAGRDLVMLEKDIGPTMRIQPTLADSRG